MVSRRTERLGGIFIATLSLLLTGWNWQMVVYEHHFSLRATLIAPAFTVIGLGLVLFPGYRTERIERGEDLSNLSGIALITPRWWGILAVALVSGAVNLLVLKGWHE